MLRRFLNSTIVRQISRLLVITTLAITSVYLFFRMRYRCCTLDEFNLPLEFTIKANLTLLILIVILYFLFYPALIFSKLKAYLAVPIFLLTLPFPCLFSFLTLDSISIIDQFEYTKHNYYYVGQPNIGDPWGIYSLYRCDSAGRNCRILNHGASNNIPPIQFQISEGGDQLFIFLNSSLMYIDGDSFLAVEGISCGYNSDFWFCLNFGYQKDELYLDKCSPYYQQGCMVWSVQLSRNDLESGHFTHSDESEDENLFYIGDELIFSVTDEPICHIEGCSFIEE